MFIWCNYLPAVIDNPTEKSQLHYKRVRCKICTGTGWDKNSSLLGSRCEKCCGTGWRLFPDGLAETCPYCLGRGKESGSICQECDGFSEIKLLI